MGLGVGNPRLSMIRDYWVYQNRQCFEPWALYIVKEYDRRKPDATSIDYTVYGEFIQNKTHSVSHVNLKYDGLHGYIEHISQTIRDAGGIFEDEEWAQLERSLLNIFTDRR